MLEQISGYIASQSEPKRSELQLLHDLFLAEDSTGRLWFLDGKNEDGKVVSNPNIGYGAYTINYANGSSKEFFRIGLSANTAGISVYVMGLADKEFLRKSYGEAIGKATVTGYCIKFKSIQDIDLDILRTAVQHGLNSTD